MNDKLDNKPLTIEELREMGGQPVYIADSGDWAIVAIEQKSRNTPPVPYLCGAHYDKLYNVSVNFYYKVGSKTIYRYPPADN